MKQFPTKVSLDGKNYEINTSYKIALKCFDIIESNVSNVEKTVAVTSLLFKDIPAELIFAVETQEKLQKYLNVGQKKTDDKPLMDFKQDKDEIYSSFVEQYPTKDLDNMHYWEFVILLKGVNPKTALGRKIELRAIDPKDYPKEQRSKIIKAQKQVAIDGKITSKEELQLLDLGIPQDFIDRHKGA